MIHKMQLVFYILLVKLVASMYVQCVWFNWFSIFNVYQVISKMQFGALYITVAIIPSTSVLGKFYQTLLVKFIGHRWSN